MPLLGWVILLGWTLSVGRCFLATCPVGGPPTVDLLASQFAKKHDNDDNQNTEVSDAEALLACYGYLKRRKRIGSWAQQELRQRMKASAQPSFFWEEDLSEASARRQRELRGEILLEEEEEEETTTEEEEETPLRPPRSNSAAEVWSGEFTSFPSEPSSTWIRRSQSAKKRWMDPDFREYWYEKRWKEHMADKDDVLEEESQLEQEIRALPSGFLGSPELSEMTNDEIAAAIQSYLTTKQKRTASRQKTLTERKAVLKKQMEEISLAVQTKKVSPLSRDTRFGQDEAALREAQRQRSERAKKLYQKRVENQKREQKSIPTSAPPARKYQPNQATPQDAMLRIQRDLDQGTLPASKDVAIIMQVTRIAKRRDVLRQILADFFDMRGKCVPIGDDGELEFVTKCPIDNLGALVMDLIQREEDNKKDS